MLWISVLSFMVVGSTASFVVDVKTDHVINKLDPHFLSVTYDQSCLALVPKFGQFNFTSVRLRTLLRGLSPAYFRFGGTSADMAVFTEASPSQLGTVGTTPPIYAMSKRDWDEFVHLTRSTGTRFLYEFNAQLRYGTQWDPSNAIALLEYLSSQGYGQNIDFEMGNEPDLYGRHPGWAVVSPTQMAEDYAMLARVIARYPAFKQSILVGPDTGGVGDYYNTFVPKAADLLTAATWHHYYFRGPTSNYTDYIDPSHFDTLKGPIKASLAPVQNSSRPDLPVWLGETSDAYNGGTLNVSDKFVSGFLWLDKLGLAASMGIKAVFRQTFFGHNYPLVGNDSLPNPDYWLSYAYKKLVGPKVLETTFSSSTLYFRGRDSTNASTFRAYAHCTQPSDRYPGRSGAVTVYVINVDPANGVSFSLSGALANLPVDQYLMVPGGSEGVLSRDTLLNANQLLVMPDEGTLPVLNPAPKAAGRPITLPSLSYGFYVIPDARVKACVV